MIDNELCTVCTRVCTAAWCFAWRYINVRSQCWCLTCNGLCHDCVVKKSWLLVKFDSCLFTVHEWKKTIMLKDYYYYSIASNDESFSDSAPSQPAISSNQHNFLNGSVLYWCSVNVSIRPKSLYTHDVIGLGNKVAMFCVIVLVENLHRPSHTTKHM